MRFPQSIHLMLDPWISREKQHTTRRTVLVQRCGVVRSESLAHAERALLDRACQRPEVDRTLSMGPTPHPAAGVHRRGRGRGCVTFEACVCKPHLIDPGRAFPVTVGIEECVLGAACTQVPMTGATLLNDRTQPLRRLAGRECARDCVRMLVV